MILIYSEKISERLKYSAHILISVLMNDDFELTSDVNEFEKETFPKINYSSKEINGAVQIIPSELLFEENIHTIEPEIIFNRNISCLFPQPKGDLNFDCFAAAFFLVSRYEEYLPFKPDRHNRFQSSDSFAVKHKFHQLPVVNYYSIFLEEKLKNKFEKFRGTPNKFKFTLSYDIDIAFKYLGRPSSHNVAGLFKNILMFDFKTAMQRLRVVGRKEADPWNTFHLQVKWNKMFNIDCVYFFLLANKSKFDRNLGWNSKAMADLIKGLAANYKTGIHPGYKSSELPGNLKTEKERLEVISEKKVVRSRHHFLKVRFPETYIHLLNHDIKEDWSLGFSDQVGFRCGIANSFPWFNLMNNQTTDLKIFPFNAMDAALYFNMKSNAKSAGEMVLNILEEVKKVNGHFIFLSHNQLINPANGWPGWQTEFVNILQTASA